MGDSSEGHHSNDEERAVAFETLNSEEAVSLVDRVQTWRYSVDSRQYGFFIAKKVRLSLSAPVEESTGQNQEDTEHLRPLTPGTPGQTLDFKWEVSSLATYEEGFFNGIHQRDQFVCFADPSSHDQHPGWMLRNLLVLVRARWSLDTVQILCYRETHSHRYAAKSKIIQLRYDVTREPSATKLLENNGNDFRSRGIEVPKISGWEINNARKVASKVSNLGEYMDPHRLVQFGS